MSEEAKQEIEEKQDVAVERLKEKFSEIDFQPSVFRGLTSVVVPKDRLLEVMQFLRDDPACNFAMLTDIGGVDWLEKGKKPRFEVFYNLNSIERKARLKVKVKVDESDLKVSSVVCIWKAADWHERECYDMFGINFEGHPDPRRIFMPAEYKGFPLRKDFPLRGYED